MLRSRCARLTALAVAGIWTVHAALAAGEPEPPPAVTALLRRHLEAAGGAAAVRKQTDRWQKGSLVLTAQGVTLQVTTVSKAPNLQLQSYARAGKVLNTTGFDGVHGWNQGADLKVSEVTGAALASLRRDADFWRTFEVGRVLKHLKIIPGKTFAGVDTAGVEGVAEDGQVEQVYFAKDTGLLRAWVLGLFDGRTLVQGAVIFDDYRDVAGVKTPWRVFVEAPADLAFDFRASEAGAGLAPPDENFRKPGGK